MALAGGVIGWLLRSLKSRAEVAAVRSTTVDQSELERLRGRVANLEPVVAERDRLRIKLADVRGSSAGALGFSSPVETSIVPADEPPLADVAGDDLAIEASGIAGVADADTRPDEPAREPAPEREPGPAPEPVLDLDAAAGVLGKRIKVDDLTVVEGIGPKIAELCSGIGVATWRALGATDVETLQSMLDAAGSRFQMHKPASWPRQAQLLAEGDWDEFKRLTDELSGGA
jgi:predicted flap endonuclease-1-like 5' DNA nuclease